MGENHFAAAPSALYGVVLFMAAIAFWILQQRIIASQGPQSLLREAVGRDWKGKLSPVFYLICDPVGLRIALDRRRAVPAGGAALAGARPAHRAGHTGVTMR